MSLRHHVRAAALVLVTAVVACAPSARNSDGDDDTSSPGLHVVPGNVSLTISAGQTATQVYSMIETDSDGNQHDVTADSTFAITDSSIGSFDGATFSTSGAFGGHTTVTGTSTDGTATAELIVLLQQDVIEPGAPANSSGLFGNAVAGGAAPTLVYPDTGVITPPNMNTLEFHFRPGAGQNLFQLTFTGSAIQLSVYFTCTTLADGCVWTPTASTWQLLATAGRGDVPLQYTLRGLDQTAGAGAMAGTSDLRTLQFSADDLVGGIYYWAASAGTVMRYDFGHPGQTADKFLSVGQTTGTQCVGCHAMSRDGTQIAVGLDIPGPAALEAYDVATVTREWTTNAGSAGLPGFPSADGANFFSFSPDNSKIVSSGGTNLVVRSAIDGTGMTTVLQNGTMPDWSPDGSSIVYARAGEVTPASNPGVAKGSIVTCDATTFGGLTAVVPSAGENNYYPAYSPDGNWIIFNRSANADDSYDQPDARVWIVPAAGGTPIALALASPPNGVGDSWPKWSTQVHMYQAGSIFWLTFSSRRAYGLRGDMDAQIWMVGVDPARAQLGMDPSFAAFWLPFQDFTSGNHIAQWVETVARQSCGDSGPCPQGELCMSGQCFSAPE